MRWSVSVAGDPTMTTYWKCQIGGWSVYALVSASIPTLYDGLSWVVVARVIAGTLLGLVLTHHLREHIRRRGWLFLSLRRLAPRIVVATIAVAALMVLGILPLLMIMIPPPGQIGPFMAIFSGHLGTVFAWIVIYFGSHYLRGVRTAETERLRLEVAMRDTQLRALRAQLNPHFLFNSLNSLRALVTEDPGRAQEAVTGLAALLRYTLRESRAQTTTLRREIDAVRHYLHLEALRFETRLSYHIDIDPRALEHPVPPMLVQTLVENAITHGIARLPEGGAVEVRGQMTNDALWVRVSNTGTLDACDGGTGLGLRNSLDQLRLLFGGRVRLELFRSGPNEVTCEVTVPSSLPRPMSGASRVNVTQ